MLALNKLFNRDNLSTEEMTDAMHQIMDGRATPAQIGAFLAALRTKGETITEITAGANVMREKALKVKVGVDYAIDTCGTGGDGAHTFNISTAVAFVTAAAGVTVVKHGNRSVSSRCGSADVLEQLGVNIDLDPVAVGHCVDKIQIGFIYAPKYHQAMKHVAQSRRELGVRTIFNVLGPLTNPARVQGQVLGVFSPELTEVMAGVLGELGVKRAMVVHGLDGLDEITLTTKTKVSLLDGGKVVTYLLDPSLYGFDYQDPSELTGGDAQQNAQIILDIFQGQPGPKRDIVVLNAAAAIYVGKQASSFKEGLEKAAMVVDQGLAYQKLQQLIQQTQAGMAS